ncbi:MBL fold metallo-hydrolase [Caballeronia glebae]|uniref:MBL fold metallo-hydrolase n=1 Tax=Caballeronia glebae TaxID=1777143 RepID=UPI0038B7D768
MATITVLEAGYCTHMGCMALKGAGLSTRCFPSRAYLIESANGCWLWDTGYASHFIDCTRSGLFAWYRRVTPVFFDESESVVRQLRARGIHPRDLDAVILSHFHGDHIAGLRDFEGTPTWLSGSGWAATRALRGVGALTRGFVPGLIPGDFETSITEIETFDRVALPQALSPFTQAYAVPRAKGEFLIVELPGHAAGHLGAFVATDDGWVLLASDSAWSPESYRSLVGPSRLANIIMEDSHQYRETLGKLNSLYRNGQARILLTHEGAV